MIALNVSLENLMNNVFLVSSIFSLRFHVDNVIKCSQKNMINGKNYLDLDKIIVSSGLMNFKTFFIFHQKYTNWVCFTLLKLKFFDDQNIIWFFNCLGRKIFFSLHFGTNLLKITTEKNI
ncbi:hypothetical protein BpHYR1_009962 [Brachionus plicatilis]|uniref:Uncharacterized protein n=1 Tax=Brachionus plicatilis TaxID=10195 RepID=A0A3M7QIN8_BRAPC|nr:hypothetical protein BpHYR1_009962 [Brachionus plicatilis]